MSELEYKDNYLSLIQALQMGGTAGIEALRSSNESRGLGRRLDGNRYVSDEEVGESSLSKRLLSKMDNTQKENKSMLEQLKDMDVDYGEESIPNRPAGSEYFTDPELEDFSGTIKELKEDVEYYKHNNTMKSMKRFYSLLTTMNKDKKKQKELVKYFNSPIGYINKIKNDLEFLLELTEKHNIEWDKIKRNLQMLKDNLANSALPSDALILQFNNLSQSNYKSKIKKIIDRLQTIINDVSKKYLRQIED